MPYADWKVQAAYLREWNLKHPRKGYARRTKPKIDIEEIGRILAAALAIQDSGNRNLARTRTKELLTEALSLLE
jgi:hypothetical protein